MKKSLLWLLSIVLILASIPGCTPASPGETGQTSARSDSSEKRLETYSQDEYVLYQNIFYKDYGKECDGSAVEKMGVYAAIYDAYNSRQRHYVWGYYDQTKCCDWQWEFVPREGETLPPVGSLVTVKGTFVSHENALDGYWITDASVATETAYNGPGAELDMLSMSGTLERVQIVNIMNHPDVFQGKAFTAYGRVAAPDSLQDPYYDNSWQIPFSWKGEVPGIGTSVTLSGFVRDGALEAQALNDR